MSLISYAQNAEDIVLNRAFPADYSGFYIDVGAAYPDIHSVTSLFYQRGWHGINIEPVPWLFELLAKERPRDVNLNVAVADAAGKKCFYEPTREAWGLGTLVPAHAEEARRRGHVLTERMVPVTTVADICERYVSQTIDFFKVDVEGAEEAVLRGMDFHRWRPRVVLVEATAPLTTTPTHRQWEHRLLNQDYRFVLFDGLNRFYVRAEDPELIEPLSVPANAFDNYTSYDHVREVERYRRELAEATAALQKHTAEHTGVVSKRRRRRAVTRSIAGVPAETADDRSVAGLRALRAPSRSPLHRTKSRKPQRRLRLAILSTPRSGNSWLRILLRSFFGIAELSAHTPADVNWQKLPASCVLQLHWLRTSAIKRLLKRHDFQPLVIARHPFDVLISILQFTQTYCGDAARWLDGEAGDERSLVGATPSSQAFLDYATSARASALLAVTCEWWAVKRALQVRYEDMLRDTPRELERIAGSLGARPRRSALAVADASTLDELRAMSGLTRHFWMGQPGLWKRLLSADRAAALAAAHHGVLAALGYRADPDRSLTDAEAEETWRNLLADDTEAPRRNGVAVNRRARALASRVNGELLKSCPCTQAQLESAEFQRWRERLRMRQWMHRKTWEMCYIPQALSERGLLEPGRRGLVFAVGREPLPALFASLGVEIVATDQAADTAGLWATTRQHARNFDALNKGRLCSAGQFRRLVTYRTVDMNDVPDDLGDFDFCWSACSFEHLGSMDKGKRFIYRMLDCLKPGGVAVHTTEYNVSSNTQTMETDTCVLFRKCDFEEIAQNLTSQGHRITLDFDDGDGPADTLVDEPPYRQRAHLKLRFGQYVVTSYGLIIEKARS